ncbi:MAG: FAD-binding oxidoreductase [Candidatus Saganbacteria bacterium]|nr:FAD-binding oxidoreductase [Candidatus Saganbacteria bacterium]
MSKIIIGGGIIGTAIAYYASQTGIKDIVLIEKEKMLGTGVTQYCSGGIRSQFTTEINCKFSIESLKELQQFNIDFKKLGYLILDMKNDSMPRVKMQNGLGIPSEYLKPGQVKERFSYLYTDGVKSASFYQEDGIADPAMLLEIYEKGARANGVRFLTETKVVKIIKEGNQVIGIETTKGIHNGTVVLAAGVQSKELGETIGLNIPIIKKRKYVVVIDAFGYDFPLTMEIPTGWYIKKEGEDALIGMSGKVEEKDFKKQEEAVEETIEASIHRFPSVEKKGIKKVLSSMSDETPDKHAIIDNSIEGLIIATGFSGHGFMHSPAVGKIVASLIKQEKPIIDISGLRSNRKHIKEAIAI